MKGLVASGIVLTLVTLVIGAATAESNADAAKKQLETATFHAGELAQRGSVAATSLMHLQHVVNCLEGPKGKNFRAAVGNPCQGQGNGIRNDLQGAVAAGVKGAERAARYARSADEMAVTVLGLKAGTTSFTEVDAIQPWAKTIATQLKQAHDALP